MFKKGYIQTEEHKLKISNALKGRHLSNTHKKNISIGNKKRFLNKEERIKTSIGMIKYLQEYPMTKEDMQKRGMCFGGNKHPMFGKKHSIESRLKMRNARLGVSPYNKGLPKEMQPCFGKQNMLGKSNKWGKHSDATKALIREKRYLQKKIFNPKTEIKIQNFLIGLEIEFHTHKYINITHGYQCDIYVPSMNLVIECDGNYWHSYPVYNEIDNIRTAELIDDGYKVLRLWESNINKLCLEDFKKELEAIN